MRSNPNLCANARFAPPLKHSLTRGPECGELTDHQLTPLEYPTLRIHVHA
jgi:hypothetical protein